MSGACFHLTVLLLCLATLASTKPIMVSFGTNQGPIIPRQPKSTAAQERSAVVRVPAPVSEDREDVPNPNTYRPPVPHQYRSKLYSFKPSANLILGTPIDIKYTPALQKYNLYRKQFARSFNSGVDYTGPHVFEKQDYEFFGTKTTLQPSEKYFKHLQESKTNEANNVSKYVPQIGVLYSAGVRYYIPQIVYVNQEEKTGNPEEENSVYGVEDEKYYQ
ncbi:GV1 [Leptinotarsa decemlineata]|uniref:GV1 n=1 Tax=Leptinotarsa decemlineata TaxID=7539 RepID=UPI003D305F42